MFECIIIVLHTKYIYRGFVGKRSSQNVACSADASRVYRGRAATGAHVHYPSARRCSAWDSRCPTEIFASLTVVQRQVLKSFHPSEAPAPTVMMPPT